MPITLPKDVILRAAGQAVPRYTSYPTAPHFHPGITGATYADWLEGVPPGSKLSLYLHIPFCDSLCWFCGCHTKITQKYAPVAAYLEALMAEINLVSHLLPKDVRVSHIHWGGGSPTILSAEDMTRLTAMLRRAFPQSEGAEFAIEVDPRDMGQDKIDALVAGGLTRVSIGVQDFDPAVQKAINRHQSVEETRRIVEAFRAGGVSSLNIDAIYGLPLQGEAQVLATLDAVVALQPDRIALFGYAHVPWMKKHQSMIDAASLPGLVERHRQAEVAARFLVNAGYEQIGIDHFALPVDTLALAAREGRVQRNFQGYTVDPADVLIGLGASSIGRLPLGYVQNEPSMAEYQRRVLNDGLATARGLELSDDDRLRAAVIERLMCRMNFSYSAVAQEFGDAAAVLDGIVAEIIAQDHDGFVRASDDGFVVTQRGRPFLRTIAARFDAYLVPEAGRHSLAV